MRLFETISEHALAVGDFLFPDQCPLCGRVLQRGLEELVCSWCLLNLPRTGFREGKDHPAAQTFWGRCRFEQVMASLVYQRHNPTQRLIHDLKYHHGKDTGLFLGKLLGRDMLQAGILDGSQVLVPVPLHPKKERRRGYNQSLVICEGIRSVLPLEVQTRLISRCDDQGSQTRLGRFSRFTHAEHLFQLEDAGSCQGRSLILVDDVITTGATLEACAQVLSAIEGVRLSAAAVAFSKRS